MNASIPPRRSPRAWLVGLALLLGHLGGSAAQESSATPGGQTDVPSLVAEIGVFEALFPAFALCHWEREPEETAFVYGDAYGVVHHILSRNGRLHERWRSFPLEGRIREVFAADLDRDGSQEIVAYTSEPRIYVWDTTDYELLWESIEENFKFIHAMVIADVDDDDPLELILCVDNRLVYYDGVEFFREKEGRDDLNPSYMLIADVDGDGVEEIITNDGFVIDSVTLTIEWSTESFGYPIHLFDLDGDGIPELVGEIRGALTFWDLDQQREMWWRPGGAGPASGKTRK